jgi:hypothetical protein
MNPSSDAFINAFNFAVRSIAGVVKKLAFLFAGWTLFRGSIRFEHISAISTFPIGHMITSFMLSKDHEYYNIHGR